MSAAKDRLRGYNGGMVLRRTPHAVYDTLYHLVWSKNAQAAPLLAAGGNEWLWQRAQCPLPKLGRGGTMAAWSSDAHPMPSTIPCITWSGRPSIAVMSCKARYNK